MNPPAIRNANGPHAPDLSAADLVDATRALPAARNAVRGAEVRVPVTTGSGTKLFVTFRRLDRPGDLNSRCWWQPLTVSAQG